MCADYQWRKEGKKETWTNEMITRGRRRRFEKGNLAGSSIVGGNNTIVSIPDRNKAEENSDQIELGRDKEKLEWISN